MKYQLYYGINKHKILILVSTKNTLKRFYHQTNKIETKQIRLLIRIMNKIEKTYKQQEHIIRRYEEIEKKQKNQEFWIKTTRYLAFAFIIVRITFFCYS